jgi:hyperosmotically inducible periplasmic protein
MQFNKYCGAIVVSTALVATPALAQTASNATAASAPASKKAIRAHNRKVEKVVFSALTRTKGLDTRAIVVVVKNGVVTLDGSVPDASQIQLAQDAAQHAAQGNSVTNNLSVKEPGN